MASPDWLSYLSLAFGVIGTVSGCLAYRRTGQLKTLDLRIELRRTDVDLRHLVLNLPAKLEYAKRSYRAASAASGSYHSGATKKWLCDFEDDLLTLKALEDRLPAADDDYQSKDSSSMESEIVKRHKLLVEARELAAKYAESVASDDKRRENIREDIRTAIKERKETR